VTISYGTAAALGHGGPVGESLGRSGLGRGRRRRGKNGVQGGGEETVEQVYFDFRCLESTFFLLKENATVVLRKNGSLWVV
jgi:hypothetical protein